MTSRYLSPKESDQLNARLVELINRNPKMTASQAHKLVTKEGYDIPQSALSSRIVSLRSKGLIPPSPRSPGKKSSTAETPLDRYLEALEEVKAAEDQLAVARREAVDRMSDAVEWIRVAFPGELVEALVREYVEQEGRGFTVEAAINEVNEEADEEVGELYVPPRYRALPD